MGEQSLWMQKVEADPSHSQWYIERFRALARAGEDDDVDVIVVIRVRQFGTESDDQVGAERIPDLRTVEDQECPDGQGCNGHACNDG